jgi:hypothetical protein
VSASWKSVLPERRLLFAAMKMTIVLDTLPTFGASEEILMMANLSKVPAMGRKLSFVAKETGLLIGRLLVGNGPRSGRVSVHDPFPN